MTDWRPFTLRQLVVRYKALDKAHYDRQSFALLRLLQAITGSKTLTLADVNPYKSTQRKLDTPAEFIRKVEVERRPWRERG